jgi:hypothetical protein
MYDYTLAAKRVESVEVSFDVFECPSYFAHRFAEVEQV